MRPVGGRSERRAASGNHLEVTEVIHLCRGSAWRVAGPGRPAGRWDLAGTAGAFVAVLANRASGGPRLVRHIPLPRQTAALGTHLTRGGKYLLAANEGAGAEVLSVSKAVRGAKGAVLGTLSATGASGQIESVDVTDLP